MEEPVVALAPYDLRIEYRMNGVPRVATLALDPRGRGVGFARGENDDLAWEVQLEAGDGWLRVAPRVTALRLGVRLDAIVPLRLLLTADAEHVRALHHGWQSWSACASLGAGDAEPRPRLAFLDRITRSASAPEPVTSGDLWSELCTALVDVRTGAACVAGYLDARSQFGGFALRLRAGAPAGLVARLPFEGVALAPGETRAGEPLHVAWGDGGASARDANGSAGALLEAWASALGAAMGARVPERDVVGWCSWYEHFERIDQRVIARNLEHAARLRERLGLELFQIDDGYQAALGDWLLPARGFPRGMAPLAAEIASHGLTPGIWLAPFLAADRSRVAREHRGWLLRDARGRAVPALFNPRWSLVSTAKALDVTHPGVLEHVATACRTLAREHGFRFLKLDFLYAAALPGLRHDARATGAEALRRALETIRGAVGDDVSLLGCGCPLGPAVGVVDVMRIGPDVAPTWSDWMARRLGRDVGLPATRNAVRNSLGRAYLHRALWLDDPDCLLVREQRTKLTADEVRTLAGVVALSGGSVLLSDDLAKLPEARVALAERALALHREVAGRPRCLDLMDSSFPRLLLAPRRAGGWLLLVLNPDDAPRATTLDLAALALPAGVQRDVALHDAWSGAALDAPGGVLDLGTLAPHASVLLAADPRG